VQRSLAELTGEVSPRRSKKPRRPRAS